MTEEMMRDLFSFIAAIAIVIGGVSIITLFNRMKKPEKFKAKIVKKEIKMNLLSTQFPRLPRYVLEFAIADGNKKMTFAVNESCYISSPERKEGTLCIQGTELLSFEGEDFNIDYTA
ncbi:MAG: hypothetical protein IJR47_04955 [Clostridia bacterium]|nr:hypothetical protein [Clostridia bacterium]